MTERKEVGVYYLSEKESERLLKFTHNNCLINTTGMSKEKVVLIQPDDEGYRSEGILYQYQDEGKSKRFAVIPIPGSKLEKFLEEFIIEKNF